MGCRDDGATPTKRALINLTGYFDSTFPAFFSEARQIQLKSEGICLTPNSRLSKGREGGKDVV